MSKDDEDRLVQMNVQVPNWVRQRLRERYVRTGEGQSAFARRAIIRLLEEEDEQRPKDGQCWLLATQDARKASSSSWQPASR